LLEQRIGHQFASNALRDEALTHRSYGTPHNERLEFLGDGVLGCVIAQELCARYPGLPEGKLTRLRASLVRQESLHAIAQSLGLSQYLKLGDGERKAVDEVRASILADSLEAVFGAVFLDGGYEAARSTILAAFGDALARLDPDSTGRDPKTRLQELAQGRHLRRPEYRVRSVSGAAHRQMFEVDCELDELGLSATGSGSSRQRAEQEAAKTLLDKIEGRGR
jgi:ribonuclease-3